MIEVVNVNKTFGEKHVLKDINATFDAGKVNMIIGRSGSGKTVLLKNIVGLVTPETGEIYFDKREFVNVDEKGKREIRKEMGMVFQGSALFTSNNVEENVMLPLDLFTKMSKAEKQKRVDFCLDRVGIVNAHHSFPSEISGGMQKRVAIARAIALNPRYLFCDEPNSGLDPQTSILIDQLIKEITVEYNITTIVNTHDMNSIMEIGDNICFIYQGNKWWQGSKDDIFTTDNPELNDFVFASVALTLASCNMPGKQEQMVLEERVLEEETMENIFYEMHLADAMVSLRLVQVDGHTSLTQYQVDSLIYESIYDKYGCTRESFEESILWYLENEPNKLRGIYERIVERFNQNIAEIGGSKTDSTALENNTL